VPPIHDAEPEADGGKPQFGQEVRIGLQRKGEETGGLPDSASCS